MEQSTSRIVLVGFVSLLLLGLLANPVAGQESVSIDSPEEVDPNSEFETTVTMTESAVGEIAVSSDDFDVTVELIENDGDSVGAETNTNVEVIDIDETDSTYTLSVELSDSEEGGTGMITASTGGNIGSEDAVDEVSKTFQVTTEGNTNNQNPDTGEGETDAEEENTQRDSGASDGEENESEDGESGEGLPGFTSGVAVLSMMAVLYVRRHMR